MTTPPVPAEGNPSWVVAVQLLDANSQTIFGDTDTVEFSIEALSHGDTQAYQVIPQGTGSGFGSTDPLGSGLLSAIKDYLANFDWNDESISWGGVTLPVSFQSVTVKEYDTISTDVTPT